MALDESVSPIRRSRRLARRPPEVPSELRLTKKGFRRKRPLPTEDSHQWRSKRPWAPPPEPYYERPPPRIMLRHLSPEDQARYHEFAKLGLSLSIGKPFERGPKVPASMWTKYYQELYDSDGFDFTPFPVQVRSIRVTVCNWDYIAETPDGLAELKGYATEALKEYNEKYNATWEVDDIDYVNGGICGNLNYYITFTAKTPTRKQTFQAKVVITPGGRSTTYPICRKKKKTTTASGSTSRP